MANTTEIQDHYDVWGPFHELRMREIHGGYPDYSCAFFDGDFSLNLAEAQQKKHAWILETLGFFSDTKKNAKKTLLDVGCGWGPMLHAAKIRGVAPTGLTLSAHQVKHCTQKGLDVRLLDYKAVGRKKNSLPVFDGIVSLGAFEHFCSVEEYLAGKQEQVYQDFFKFCAAHLKKNGKLFVQTMTWGGHNPDYSKASLNGPKHAKETSLKRLQYFYPGSWLPEGLDQMVACAKKAGFTFVSANNGRLDYLETLKGWSAQDYHFWQLKYLPETVQLLAKLIYRYLTDRGTRIQWSSIRCHDQANAFRFKWMSHERIFFQKKS